MPEDGDYPDEEGATIEGPAGCGAADLWDLGVADSFSKALSGLSWSLPESARVSIPTLDLIGEGIRRAIAASWSDSLAPLSEGVRRQMLPALERLSTSSLVPAGLAASQAMLAEMAARIADTSGLTDRIREALEPVFAAQRSQFERIFESLADSTARLYPENWRDATDLDWQTALTICLEEGIPLAGVPRRETVEALMAATTSAQRRSIIGRRWRGVAADCAALLSEVDEPELQEHVRFAHKALRALRDGHPEAAQALLASLIDTMQRRHLAKDLQEKVTRNRKNEPPLEVDEFTMRVALVVAPIWASYAEFWERDGDPIPTTFARHASAHAVSGRQFSRINAVVALMVATSLIWFLGRNGSAAP